jgi:hypothetical protein
VAVTEEGVATEKGMTTEEGVATEEGAGEGAEEAMAEEATGAILLSLHCHHRQHSRLLDLNPRPVQPHMSPVPQQALLGRLLSRNELSWHAARRKATGRRDAELLRMT